MKYFIIIPYKNIIYDAYMLSNIVYTFIIINSCFFCFYELHAVSRTQKARGNLALRHSVPHFKWRNSTPYFDSTPERRKWMESNLRVALTSTLFGCATFAWTLLYENNIFVLKKHVRKYPSC